MSMEMSADGHDTAVRVADRELDGAKPRFVDQFLQIKRRPGGGDLPIDFFKGASRFRRKQLRFGAAEGNAP